MNLPAEQCADREETVQPRKRWKYVRRIVHNVWRRWLQELVPQLNIRTKWHCEGKNIKKGDVVLLHEDGAPRAHWPIGRVTEIFVGRDGIVRVVEVEGKGKI